MNAGADVRRAEEWGSRPTLTVWAYDSPMGAAAGHVRLRELQRRGAVAVEDAITVTWVPGTHRPRIGHLRAPSPRGGWVLGALVEVLLRPTFRDQVPTMAAALEGTGVDERILGELRAAIAPGWSVLLVLSSGADPDLAGAAIQRGLARGDVTMTYAVLAGDAVERLRSLRLDPHSSRGG
ncbi:hypothetical protein [Nocardioides sp. YIM 152315]|uniref:hypothetical protein n=1 Tax=Nocardioides sp. YIM 152315 TaxID=3031760 RepID=UPI0023D9DB5D|nr:hypothetical protein [Nocardioides sp. YIM 152315]MDF1605765.1 hypothetical protein [Nocardioides sp. YIM 152315]